MLKQMRKIFGIRNKSEIERDKEMDYRMKLSQARRETETIRRDMLRLKKQAYDHESQGEHDKAVALALQAVNKEKVIANAEVQLRKCTNIHDMARTQRAVTNIMQTCRDLSNGIVELADMEGAMRIQEENEEALARMEDAGEQMEMFAEGIGGDLMPEVRNAAGEAALASILAEQDAAAAPVRAVKPENRQEILPEEPSEDNAAWIRSRREDLQALSAEM